MFKPRVLDGQNFDQRAHRPKKVENHCNFKDPPLERQQLSLLLVCKDPVSHCLVTLPPEWIEDAVFYAGLLRSMEKVWSFSNLGNLQRHFFGLLVWKKKNNFPDFIFDVPFHNILFKMDNFTSIVLTTIIVPVFDLGMSFVKVQAWERSGNLYSKLRRIPGLCDLENC